MGAIEKIDRPYERRVPSLVGAIGWLNSPPLTPKDLRGRVVVFNFGTFSSISWLRSLPYVRAWSERYRDDGLIVVGVHTPEFAFERDPGAVAAILEQRHIGYPVALDNRFAIWAAFANRYSPALLIADQEGVIRYHHVGEGEYERSEGTIQRLLGVDRGPVPVDARGDEAPPERSALASPSTYIGYERMRGFASPGGELPNHPRRYGLPARLGSNRWALLGAWKVGIHCAVLHEAGGRIAYRFHARDLHLVMGSSASPVRFRVTVDGRPPGSGHGLDVDPQGQGVVSHPRLYQLVRQTGAVTERTFEVTFMDSGVLAYLFTFG